MEHYLLELANVRVATIRKQALTKDDNMNDYDDVMNRLNNAKPVSNFDPYLSDGQHALIVHSIEPYQDQKWGESFRISFYVEQSTKHPVGSLVCRTHNINKPAMFSTQPNDTDTLIDFICVLQGIPLGKHQASAKALLYLVAKGGQLENQPARGCRINATGIPPKPGMTAAGKPKTYTKITYQTVQQTAAMVGEARAMLDKSHPMGAPRPQQSPMQPQQGYQQVPQQTPPQYPSQPVQPQAIYSQPAPSLGYIQQPPQGVYQPPPAQTPIQQVGQQYLPSGSSIVQPPPGVPQGGFLALLPPK